MNIIDRIFVDPVSKAVKFLSRSGLEVKPVPIEYAYNTNNSDANDTSSFAIGPLGVTIGSFTAGRQKRVRFSQSRKDGDRYEIQFKEGVEGAWIPAGTFTKASLDTINLLTYQNTAGYGVGIKQVNSTDFDVLFLTYAQQAGTTYGSAGSPWSQYTGVYWRVAKISL